MAPEPCYFCRKPRDSYFGMLCDECRKRAEALEKSIDKARGRNDSRDNQSDNTSVE